MYAVVIGLLLALLSSGCNSISPTTWVNPYNNMLTPDRLGVGVSKGSMNAYGVSNKFIPNQEDFMETDWDGDLRTTSIWLEWDIPQWPTKNLEYERYLKERIRAMDLMLRKEALVE